MSDFEVKQITDGVKGASFGPKADSEAYSLASRHGTDFIQAAYFGSPFNQTQNPENFPSTETGTLELASNYMGTIKNFSLWQGTNISESGIESVSQIDSYVIWDAEADTYVSRIYE